MARRFGSGKVVEIAHNADQTGLGALTLVSWIIRRGATPSSNGRLIAKPSTSGSEEYGLLAALAGNRARFRVRTSSLKELVGTTSIDQDVPFHIAGTYDGTNMRIFKDGVLESSVGKTGTTSGDDSNIGIGNHPQSLTDRYFDGDVFESALWDRQLSGQEINMVRLFGVLAVPKGLLIYVPVDGNPTLEKEYISDRTVTHTGSPAKSDHAGISVVGGRAADFQVFTPGVAAPPAGIIPLIVHHRKMLGV